MTDMEPICCEIIEVVLGVTKDAGAARCAVVSCQWALRNRPGTPSFLPSRRRVIVRTMMLPMVLRRTHYEHMF
jgi:hypothetical protein